MSSDRSEKGESATSTGTSTGKSIASGNDSRISTRPCGGNSDKLGRSRVHARLRSILMSPTSFTLFRGFNPKALKPSEFTYEVDSVEKKPRVEEKKIEVNVDIVGLPKQPPNFIDVEEDSTKSNFNFHTILADFFTKDQPAAAPKEKKPKLDIAASADVRTTLSDIQEETVVTGEAKGSCDAAAATGIHLDQVDKSGSIKDVDSKSNEIENSKTTEPRSATASEFDEIKEIELTSSIRTQLFELTNERKNVYLAVQDQVTLSDRPNYNGRAHLMFFPKKKAVAFDQEGKRWLWKGNGKQTPLGLVEFGILHKQDEAKSKSQKGKSAKEVEMDAKARLERCFWEKTCQATTYLSMLRKDDNWEWSGPLLLGVFIVTRFCEQGCFAVFVCEPKGGNDWRMALMWRSLVYSKASEQLSKDFGAFLKAVDYLAARDDETPTEETPTEETPTEVTPTEETPTEETPTEETPTEETPTDNKILWEYLGPNCTLVKIKRDGADDSKKKLKKLYVARSYDNRCRHALRKSEVYKKWARLHKFWHDAGLPPMIRLILELDDDKDDESNTLEFAAPYERPDESSILDESMFFSKWMNFKGGKVEVILVPYQEGSHMCTSIVQVLSLLYFIEDMHSDLILHGDLRGRNILFLEEFDEEESEFLRWNGPDNEAPAWHVKMNQDASEQSDKSISQGAINQLFAVEGQVAATEHPAPSREVGAIDPQVEELSVVDTSQGSIDRVVTNQQDAKSIRLLQRQEARRIEDEDLLISVDERIEIVRDKFKFACLIDFDYGGHKDNKPKYPIGYQHFLADGIREEVLGLQPVEEAHDVVAATSVLKTFHELADTSRRAVKDLWTHLIKAEDLTEQIKIAEQLLRIFPKKAIVPEKKYRKHLETSERKVDGTVRGGYKVTPARLSVKPLVFKTRVEN